MAKKKNTNVATQPGMDEKKWREEDDARTLSRAAEIKADKPRMKGAKAGAQRMIDEESEKLKALKSIARTKIK